MIMHIILRKIKIVQVFKEKFGVNKSNSRYAEIITSETSKLASKVRALCNESLATQSVDKAGSYVRETRGNRP